MSISGRKPLPPGGLTIPQEVEVEETMGPQCLQVHLAPLCTEMMGNGIQGETIPDKRDALRLRPH